MPNTRAQHCASGGTIAALSPVGDFHLFAIGGLHQVLPAGEYWLGINNTVTDGIETTAAAATGVLPGAKQSDGVEFFFDDVPERAFRIYGVAVPEPSGLVLVMLGLLIRAAAGADLPGRPQAT